MYRVFLERAAEKQLKQLPAKLHDRVIEAVQALSKDPRPTGCRKLTGTDKVTHNVREYAAQKDIDEQAALGVGMKEKSEEFVASGAEIYAGPR